MIPNAKKLFGNIFDNKNITPNYLARFADDVVAKLTQDSNHIDFGTMVLPIKNALILLRTELGQVDISLNSQMGKTANTDEFIAGFSAYMKDNYVFIAAALGGDKTSEFREFYPKGKSEYNRITKTKMETVMQRLNTLAETYETELGVAISAKLQGFQSRWTELRGIQLLKKSELKMNRSERTQARRNLEIALLKTMYGIGQKYPGEIEKCAVYFDFHLLFGVHQLARAQDVFEV